MSTKNTHWIDSKGREVEIKSMSDYWLNNIRKAFRDQPASSRVKPILEEIKRRKQIRKTYSHDTSRDREIGD